MSDQFLAEIRIFPFNFAPIQWAFCNGQLLPISQNSALFSLIGTFYGGDGRSTFALPNLQGCCAIDAGQGPGLSQYAVGETGGSTNVTLTIQELPAHPHDFMVKAGSDATTASAGGNVFEKANFNAQGSSGPIFAYTATAPGNTRLNANAIAVSGSSAPHNNMMPYLTLNFCIAMQGIFPSRG
jgi:microcystin-dependent protein